jgi:hypothetical protein
MSIQRLNENIRKPLNYLITDETELRGRQKAGGKIST